MKRQDARFVLIILAAAFLVVSPLVWNGVPVGNDLEQHYQFAVSLSGAWAEGDVYPGWAAQENKGYGGVGLRFYPPLSYAVLAACQKLAGNWHAGLLLALAWWLALGGVGVYAWARSWLASAGALVAALIYLVTPYQAMKLTMSFYAEFAAGAILPFCLLYVTRLARGGAKRDILGLAVAYAALLLTSLPLALIGSLALGVYGLAGLRRESWRAGIMRLASGGLLGLAAASFHWIKVVTEKAWINHNSAAYSSTGDHYNYKRYFLFFFRYWWDDSNPNASAFMDKAVAATLMITLPLALLFYWKTVRSQRSEWRNVLALLAFSFIMATPLSWLLWSKLTFLQQTQFPVRWIPLISLSLALLAGAGWEHLPRDRSVQKNRLIMLAAGGGALICLSFVAMLMFRKTIYLPKLIVRQMTERAVSDLNYDCWWPLWARKETFKTPEKVVIQGRQAQIMAWQTYERAFRVEAGAAGAARVALLYYPHWRATVNGQPVTPAPAPDGALTVNLPAAESLVTLSFQEPPAVFMARRVARVAWLLILLGGFVALVKARREGNSFESRL
jgi:hypothetical protein